MPRTLFLIDGYNVLFAGLPGRASRSRSAIDRWRPRVERSVAQFLRRENAEGILFWDGFPRDDGAHTQVYNERLSVYYAGAGRDAADYAIVATLDDLPEEPRRVVVVSSDRAVKGPAKAARCTVIGGGAFAQRLGAFRDDDSGDRPDPEPGKPIPPASAEVHEWLAVFGDNLPADVDLDDLPEPYTDNGPPVPSPTPRRPRRPKKRLAADPDEVEFWLRLFREERENESST